MKTTFKLFLLGFIVCNCSLIAQTNNTKTAINEATAKSKKIIYIENYISNFPYKNSEIYPVICNTSLWDTTGAVPVINLNTIMINMERKTEKNK